MKKLFFAGAAAIALAASPASGADLPRKPIYKAPPPVVAPVPFSWTGFYVGLNAGGAGGREAPPLMLPGDWTSTAFNRHDTAIFAAVGSQGTHPSSFTGGGQVGYNLQTGPAVLGIEADLNSLRLHASRFISSVPGTLSAPYSFAESFETDWIAPVLGRLVYAPHRVLIYATW